MRVDGCSYTEKDWNEDSVKQVEEKGTEVAGSDSYRASKTMAEQALWSESRHLIWLDLLLMVNRVYRG